MIVDSNIIIYAVQQKHAQLRDFIAVHAPAVSAASYVEVLGYHKLTEPREERLRRFFSLTTVLPIGQDVLDQAVHLRQQHKMSLGDALIAATAMVHRLTLVTHNVADFDWIDGLTILDPLAEEI
jgi:predicted nucleic acid-binding protein